MSEAIVHLWVGGLENLSKESAIPLWFQDEEDRNHFPPKLKRLYALGMPLIWFEFEVQSEDEEEEPKLHEALSKDFFTHHFTYSIAELQSLLAIPEKHGAIIGNITEEGMNTLPV